MIRWGTLLPLAGDRRDDMGGGRLVIRGSVPMAFAPEANRKSGPVDSPCVAVPMTVAPCGIGIGCQMRRPESPS